MQLTIKTPAKINLSLDVLGLRSDGYHDIVSIMQAISLYDILTFNLTPSNHLEIHLSGTDPNIPYNEKNLVYKAIELFYKNFTSLKYYKIEVYINKNIPTEAGLGGGSANAAGAIWALNKLLETNLNDETINSLCAQLGSDLNVCYWGGTALATSRGEKLKKLPTPNYYLSIIKPVNFGISAKDGYNMFDELNIQPVNSTEKLVQAITLNKNIINLLHNDLEIAPLKKFEILQKIKNTYPDAIMTGSGSAYFSLHKKLEKILPSEKFLTIQGLNFISSGIEQI